jgi:hypothetical protein
MTDVLTIVLRFVHIVFGATWVGFAVFAAFFLGPALQDVGPDGGKVMGALQRRGLMTVMPLLAVLTIVSGFWMFYRMSAGFQPEFMRSRVGATFITGGTIALLGFVFGLVVVRPKMTRMAALMQEMPTITDERVRQERMSEATRLRATGALANKVLAMVLLLALAMMAVARYLG